VVDTEKDEGEGLDPDVRESVDEASIDVERKPDLLLEVECKGTHEVDGEVTLGHGCRGKLGARHDRHVAHGLAQAAHPAVESSASPRTAPRSSRAAGPRSAPMKRGRPRQSSRTRACWWYRSATVVPPVARIREPMDPMRKWKAISMS